MNLIEELMDRSGSSGKMWDQRGITPVSPTFSLQKLHVISGIPAFLRGNHVHDENNVLCILGGHS